jgi:ABC-type transport system substrate-binding protein
MMGSGPYRLDYLNDGVSWSIVRYTNFWGGWGTTRGSLLGIPSPSLGYLDRITEYFVSDYSTRLAGFTGTNPIYDTIAVPRSQIATVWQQPGIKCTYPLLASVVDALFFSYDVSMLSPYIGLPTSPTYFGPNGIRPDFFSDVHARRAVAYSFNWTEFVTSAYMGEAQRNVLPLPAWDAFYNSSLTGYSLNIAKAIEEWKLAWGGQVWTNGFRFSAVYNTANVPRQTVSNMLKTVLESENPLFHVDVVEMPWTTYDYLWRGGPGGRAIAPIFQVGWPAYPYLGYPDADDWVTHFIESTTPGTYPFGQHIDMDPYSTLMDNLIEWARHNTTYEGRNYNYQQLWQLYIQQAPSVPLEEAVGRRFERDWVHGWYYNPAYPGVYGYTMWKQELPREDVNSDGKVDIKDLAIAAKAFGAYYIQPLLPPYPSGPPGYHTPNWNSKADVNIVNTLTGARSDMKVDIKDLATMAKLYGYVAPDWQPPP